MASQTQTRTEAAIQRLRRSMDVALDRAPWLLVNIPGWLAGAALRRLKSAPLDRGLLNRDRIRSILVTRVDGLGDLVIFAPFLQCLRMQFPGAWISLVVDEKLQDFMTSCPWVNEVIGFDESGSKYARGFLACFRAWRLAARRLHSEKFDLAITPRWDVDSRAALFVGYFSLARHHVGFTEKTTKRRSILNRGSNRLLSHIVDGSAEPSHEHHRNREILERLEIPLSGEAGELWLTADDITWADRALRSVRSDSDQPLVCFGIGAVEAKRTWPVEYFAETARWLIDTLDANIIVAGDRRDRAYAEWLRNAAGPRVFNFAGTCSLARSAAIIRRCDLFIGNDSGPMHIASAAGVPVVEISCHPGDGSANHVNSPVRYRPRSAHSVVLQPRTARSPCRDACMASAAHCILDVTPRDAQKGIGALLESHGGAGLRRCPA